MACFSVVVGLGGEVWVVVMVGVYRAHTGRMHGSKYAHENDLGNNGEGMREAREGVSSLGGGGGGGGGSGGGGGGVVVVAVVVVVVVVVVHMTLHLMLRSSVNLRKFV